MDFRQTISCLAALAAIAVGAVGATSASAAKFHSEKEKTSLTGGQVTQESWQFTVGSVICGEISYSGAMTTFTPETLSLQPSYAGCEVEGLFEVPVATNGCDFVYHATSATTGTMVIATCGTNK